MVMRIYLNGLCTAGVNRFNDIFTSFYACQWYDVSNDVTHMQIIVPLTVKDRLLIKALHIEKGWRCGSNDCGFPARQWKQRTFLRRKEHNERPFLVTMSTSTYKHRYKNKLLGLLLPPLWRKTLHEISNFIVKILLYLICIVSLMTDT